MICRSIQKALLSGLAIIGILALCFPVAADPLVTRNDFICYDTLGTEYIDRSGWNDVSIDSAGRDVDNSHQPVILWHNWQSYYGVSAKLMVHNKVATIVPGDVNLDINGDILDVCHIVDYLLDIPSDPAE
ncbi:MAG: hypothetical protein OEW00_11475 [candidate division Zixibacteria bacterium]|nr:hypothetical protein [candidate division Zixibacteria bacterium]